MTVKNVVRLDLNIDDCFAQIKQKSDSVRVIVYIVYADDLELIRSSRSSRDLKRCHPAPPQRTWVSNMRRQCTSWTLLSERLFLCGT